MAEWKCAGLEAKKPTSVGVLFLASKPVALRGLVGSNPTPGAIQIVDLEFSVGTAGTFVCETFLDCTSQYS